MIQSMNIAGFLYCWVIIVILIKPSLAFQTTCSKTVHTIAFQTLDDESAGTRATDAQKLLAKAAQLRTEIAKAEGKTLEQVEDEAREKKQEEIFRIDRAQEETKIAAQKRREINPSNDENNTGRFLQVPATFDDMVRQAARAVERAFKDGKTRQTVRFNLVGEEESVTEENAWPGGTKQMYRESGKPLTDALLREVRAPTKNVDEFPEQRRLNPTLKKQDIWDFDGSAIHTAEAAEGPSADIQVLVFPNTDTKYLDDIDKISEAMGSRLFLLVNPFWKNVESWGFNILAPGAKKRAQEVVFGENSFDDTYSMMLFSVRGEKCVALKAYPYNWQLFAFREDDYYPSEEIVIRLGSCLEDPNSALITGLLNERPEFKLTKTMRQIKKL
mmetsp:Transcript_39967/g.40492  ORF Transcript_39967/g.40492 Transcript_39967/m.40492 type:complete len:386 (+) Transcript_39967:26-1183(+)|eukprot:CAMPEP_0170962830 /NCGR_PEP_ID=MMETSP0735-20130129/39149_1 /TAXON_ID=186038 /ORGANISM="Fragilariopsis kerguelensis, Strain L26-C5" /LENGTH=385 /DNA_ID=CAMNT_0011379249 /DNA_START=23 /DNA_END=1180 /DNA_ORIENTATION=-